MADLPATSMVSFELYPWHTARLSAPLSPDASVLQKFVWDPVAELGAPVFAFGKDWVPLLLRLGLRQVAELRQGPRLRTAVASRVVHVFRTIDERVTVVAEYHQGSAAPPNREETVLLREAVRAYL